MSTIIHLCNLGKQNIFHEEEDYITFHNKFVIAAVNTGIEIWALNILSNHFHSILEIPNEKSLEQMISAIKRAYSHYYSHKYLAKFSYSFDFSITPIPVGDINTMQTKLNYVLRNHCKHFIDSSPFHYPYTTTIFYFIKQIYPATHLKAVGSLLQKYKDLPWTAKERISRRSSLPDEFLIEPNGRISPLSYLQLAKVRTIYHNSLFSFLINMNEKPTRDNEGKGIDGEILEAQTIYRLSDNQVFQIIKKFISAKGLPSFHHLDEQDLETLAKELRYKTQNSKQVARCLWL